MSELELIIIIIFLLIVYTYFTILLTKHDNSKIYKQQMQNAQNTAKQYRKSLKEKKKAYKTLQRSYSCLEQENKCLKAKLCEKENGDSV